DDQDFALAQHGEARPRTVEAKRKTSAHGQRRRLHPPIVESPEPQRALDMATERCEHATARRKRQVDDRLLVIAKGHRRQLPGRDPHADLPSAFARGHEPSGASARDSTYPRADEFTSSSVAIRVATGNPEGASWL